MYYRFDGKSYDVYCGNSDAMHENCDCYKCRFCMVEELETGKTYAFAGSEFEKKYSPYYKGE